MEEAGLRLDQFLSGKLGISRTQAQRWIKDGRVSVGGMEPRAGLRLPPGTTLTVTPPLPAPSPVTPEAIPITVVYEDADLLVVDKPAGLAVHPAPGHPSGTLVNALLARYPELARLEGPRPGIVHRLDKDTSGLLIVARTARALGHLRRQFESRTMSKGYLALVAGRLSPEEGIVEGDIGRHPSRRQLMAVVSRGKEARTRYRVLRYLPGYTLVEVTPETGRTHQIRVHFAAIGHPLLGDRTYGQPSPLLQRHFLHAHRLGLTLPGDGHYVDFTSPLPPELQAVLDRLEAERVV